MKIVHATIETTADNTTLYNALISATQKSGATIFATGKHEFHPFGISAFVILGESHTAIHSFPEKKNVWVEVASCTDNINTNKFFENFISYLSARFINNPQSN
ncbi:MAG: S-adenosylmethionine decarboxylase [Prolixibacteraceae bacterium]|nr:S-adenosylmethionine decarboxylase [Prolixibacteraceae bacterium]